MRGRVEGIPDVLCMLANHSGSVTFVPINGVQGHAEAVQCLEGRHLLFLGDSLSR